MTTGVILSLLAAGLALLLARETKLRRALQSLCSRLVARLAEVQRRGFTPPSHDNHSHSRSRRR